MVTPLDVRKINPQKARKTQKVVTAQSPTQAAPEGVEWLKVLAEKSPAGIYLTDTTGGFLWVNKEWSELAGRPPESAMGDGWRHTVHPDDRERLVSEWKHASSGRASFVSEYRCLRPDGTSKRVLSRATEYSAPDGRFLGYIGVTIELPDSRPSRRALKEISKSEEAPSLSKREREVAGLLAEGNSNKQVAKRLGISVRTAEAHRARIMRKLRLGSLAALVRYAIQSGLAEK